jgi:hypothetical protein
MQQRLDDLAVAPTNLDDGITDPLPKQLRFPARRRDFSGRTLMLFPVELTRNL